MQALIIIEALGKVGTWKKVLGGIGFKANVVATHGHVSRFPDRLWPLGISFQGDGPCDKGRSADPRKADEIIASLNGLGSDAPIFIAADDDVEGDVIALDVIELLLAHDRRLASRIFRARPKALNREAISYALENASPLRSCASDTLARAIPGRTRAISDRWIGAVFSRMIGHPAGRVRSALLGGFFLLERAPHLLQGAPEIGEIVLRCRSGGGGLPFVSRISLTGRQDPDQVERLVDLAERFRGKLVPGVVRPRQSLSAAVAPRIGSVRPFNTGDAIAYAARHFNLGAAQAMAGLQDAYTSGMISYPRTDSRDISRESAVRVARIAEACRLGGVDVAILHGEDGPTLADPRPGAARKHDAHEALHPVCDFDREKIARFEEILRAPIPFRDRSHLGGPEICDIMTALVSRRAIEAARRVAMEPGDWRPDNGTPVTPQDAELLSDLDWEREQAVPLPWSKDLMTGARQWPLRAVAIDLMMSEGIGRPSTYAAHADTAEMSGEIEMEAIGALPRPTPLGRKVLAKLPRGLWNPGTCRMIEAAFMNHGNLCEEDAAGGLQLRMARRVHTWFRHLPQDMQQALLAGLDDGSGTREADPKASISDPEASSEGDPCSLPSGLAAPTPFAT